MTNVTKLIPSRIYTCDFELFGKLTNSLLRKDTQQSAKLLGVTGWCESTKHGSFRGQLQGLPNKVIVMRNWLKDTPVIRARIDFVQFSEMKLERFPTFHDFKIRPDEELPERFGLKDAVKDLNNMI